MCHQTVCLVARHLEANGLPTVCLASALDIMQAGRAPRTVFIDYPLGHTSGKAFDRADQLAIVTAAVTALEQMTTAGQIVQLPQQWGDDDWRAEAGSSQGNDTRQPRDDSPQFQFATDRDAALAAGNLRAD